MEPTATWNPGRQVWEGGADRPVLRAIGAVLGDLSTLGFDAVWQVVSAAEVGAPHLRKRVFILAWPAADPPRFGHRDARAASVRGIPAAAVRGGTGADGLSLLPTPRATDGTKGGPNQRGSSGDLMLPSAVMQLLPTPTATPYGNNQSPSAGAAVRPSLNSLAANALLPTPTAMHTARNATANRTNPKPTTTTTSWTLADVAYADRWGEYAPAIARWEQVTGRSAPDPTEPGTKGQPRLAARFVEWMQGLPDGYVTAVPGTSRNDALKLLGNANPPQQYAAAITQLAALVAHITATEAVA